MTLRGVVFQEQAQVVVADLNFLSQGFIAHFKLSVVPTDDVLATQVLGASQFIWSHDVNSDLVLQKGS